MKDYIKIGAKSYRVEANWNATADYCRRKGVTKLSEMDSLADMSPDDVLTLMHCCLKEGERMDERDIDITSEDLGSMINTQKMNEFIRIYASQSTYSSSVREKLHNLDNGNDGSKKK